jgi:hypothetical protein
LKAEVPHFAVRFSLLKQSGSRIWRPSPFAGDDEKLLLKLRLAAGARWLC